MSDGIINIIDALIVARYSAGVISDICQLLILLGRAASPKFKYLKEKAMNKKNVLVMSFLLMLSAGLFGLGDVNNSGQVDIVDALQIARYSAGLNPEGFYLNEADVDCSGNADIIDAMLVARYSAGLLNALPCDTPPTTTNLALGMPTAASSTYGDHTNGNSYYGAQAVDGDTTTRWASQSETTPWLEIDFGKNTTFGKTVMVEYGNRITGYTIQYYNGSWNTAFTGGNPADTQTDTFTAVTGSRVRLQVTVSSSEPSIYEFEVYYTGPAGTTPEPTATPSPAPTPGGTNSPTVFTLAELRAAIQESNQDIVMKAGNYEITELSSSNRNFPCSGSNNSIDLTGVYIEVPVGSTARATYITVSGNNNTITGGTFEDTYTNGMTEVTDFVSYNNDPDLSYGLKGAAVMTITGDNNSVIGTKLTVRGSFPYGYGSMYGIGSDNVFGLNKRCAILLNGDSNTIDGCEIQHRAFGHGIYMQSPADNSVIKNTLVEGAVRASNELYSEGSGSLPYRSDYLMPLESGTPPIPMDEVFSLSEDGIRVYTGGGSVTVENCTVKKMRGGIRLYLASSATVTNSKAIDCGMTNWNMPKGGTVINSSGNFSYAPLSDFRLSRSNQNLELTILPSPNATGPHNIADILGSNHTIVFHRAPGPLDSTTRAIVVYGNNSTIRNETEYRIILNSGTSGNKITSAGNVTDNGSNSVTPIDLEL